MPLRPGDVGAGLPGPSLVPRSFLIKLRLLPWRDRALPLRTIAHLIPLAFRRSRKPFPMQFVATTAMATYITIYIISASRGENTYTIDNLAANTANTGDTVLKFVVAFRQNGIYTIALFGLSSLCKKCDAPIIVDVPLRFQRSTVSQCQRSIVSRCNNSERSFFESAGK